MSTVIIFSKDRPMQLHAYLESLLLFSDCRQENIYVLYKEVPPICYCKVIGSFPKVNWLSETDFEQQVRKIVDEAEDTIMFGCDDVLFLDCFSLDEMRNFLLENEEVFGFSVRIGKNIGPFPRKIRKHDGDICDWVWKGERTHYGYPWELDCTLYRKEDVQSIIQDMDEFSNPNYLEAIPEEDLERYVHRDRMACYYSKNKAAVITVNRVQDTHPNGVYEIRGSDALSLFLQYHYEGRRIDIEEAAKLRRDTVHVDGRFLLRKNSIKQSYVSSGAGSGTIRNLFHNIRMLCGSDFREELQSMSLDLERKIYLQSKTENANAKVFDCFGTVKLLQQSPRSFARFGDGELTLMQGEDIAFQEYDPELALALWEIFTENTEDYYVGVPYQHFQSYLEFRPFVKQFGTYSGKWIREFLCRYLPFNREVYIDTGFNQVYQTYEENNFDEYYEQVKQLFKDKDITVIAGKGVLDKLQYDVFEYARSKNYLDGPSKNAYAEYDTILQNALQIDKGNLMCIILGPTSKVLMRDLTNAGYMAWDVGHLAKDYDSFCRREQRTGEKIAKFYAPD